MIPSGFTPVVWIEKGYGLNVRLRELGHLIVDENRVKFAADPTAVEAIIAAYTLDEAKDYRKEQIDRFAAKLLTAHMDAGFGAGSAFIFAMKLTEARHVLGGGTSQTLTNEAADRGIPPVALANQIIAKANALAARERQIADRLARHKDAVDALTDATDVAHYDASTGWPDPPEPQK